MQKNRVMVQNLAAGFARSAAAFKKRPALEVDGATYTYAALGELVARIAQTIPPNAQSADIPIAIFGYRSLTAYAGILGILAAGRPYTPLHPEHPPVRTRSMLNLAGADIVVVGSECMASLEAVLPEVERPLLLIFPDTDSVGDLRERFPQHRFLLAGDMMVDGALEVPEVGAEDIAYLLFTSGSTGVPKGVPVWHRSVRDYIAFIGARYQVTCEDRFSQTFDLTFDPSVHDMFVCWEHGACLCCVPKTVLMAPARFIREKELTIWASVPSIGIFLSRMRMLKPGSFPSLRWSMFCGEPLTAMLAEAWQQAAPNSVVENQYGPTEATVTITGYTWDAATSPGECLNGSVPMGHVFETQQGRVVDENWRPVALAEAGELCLAGSQVAQGYWNNPEKTGAHFVHLPGTSDTLWYRTGDLVLQDETGILHYLGRIDQQVKIRGQRTELQEIDHVLRKAAGMEAAVCIAWPVRNGSADGVVAFLQGPPREDVAEMLAYCRTHLPTYMVPRAIHFVDEIPLSLNGKIDRRPLIEYLENHNNGRAT